MFSGTPATSTASSRPGLTALGTPEGRHALGESYNKSEGCDAWTLSGRCGAPVVERLVYVNPLIASHVHAEGALDVCAEHLAEHVAESPAGPVLGCIVCGDQTGVRCCEFGRDR